MTTKFTQISQPKITFVGIVHNPENFFVFYPRIRDYPDLYPHQDPAFKLLSRQHIYVTQRTPPYHLESKNHHRPFTHEDFETKPDLLNVIHPDHPNRLILHTLDFTRNFYTLTFFEILYSYVTSPTDTLHPDTIYHLPEKYGIRKAYIYYDLDTNETTLDQSG